MKLYTLFSTSLILLGLTISCKSPQTDKEAQNIIADSQHDEPVNDAAEGRLNNLIAKLPLPSKEFTDLNSDMAYNENLLNPTGNISLYQTNFEKTLNYGIYSIDLIYSAAFNKKLQVGDYMKTTQKLADDLGAGKINADFSKIDFEKVSKNRDSLMDISNRAYWAMDGYLKSNKRMEAVALIFTGSWIETQFIILQQKRIKKEIFNTYLRKHIIDQKEQLVNLIALLNEFKTADISKLSDHLAEYQKTYNQLITKDSDINEENLKALSEKMSGLRGTIVWQQAS